MPGTKAPRVEVHLWRELRKGGEWSYMWRTYDVTCRCRTAVAALLQH